MNKNLICAVTLASTACLSGCEKPVNEHGHAELEQMLLEIEQLTNQIGRLEFRIYELENNGSDSTAEAAAATTKQDANTAVLVESLEPSNIKTDDGRYDLTPRL